MKSGLHLLLVGVNQQLWNLGERVLRWGSGPSARPVPAAPPRSMLFGQLLSEERLAESIRGYPSSNFVIEKPYQAWASAHLLGSIPLLELPLPSRVCDFFLVRPFDVYGLPMSFCLLRRFVGEVDVPNPHLILTWKREERVPPLLTRRHPLL